MLATGVVLEAFRVKLRLLALYGGLKDARDGPRLEALERLYRTLDETRIDATPRQLAAASMILYDSNWSLSTSRNELPPEMRRGSGRRGTRWCLTVGPWRPG